MKRNVMALALSAATVVGGIAPAFADAPFTTKIAEPHDTMDDGSIIAVDDNKFSKEEVEYVDPAIEEAGEYGATVYAEIGSTYKVTIPKVIVLAGKRGEASTATYKVDVDGDIAGNQYVKVANDATFAMKQAGKADVEATVSQNFTKFYAKNNNATLAADVAKMNADDADAIADGEGTGSVSATLTAGKWAGNFNFNIALVTE